MLRELTGDEKEKLEENILRDGYAINPIMTWHDHIVDGHNRYDICSHYGLPYETQDLNHLKRPEVLRWIIDNQQGRRNLTPQELSYSRGSAVNNATGRTKMSTAAAVAKAAGVTERTVRNDAKYADDVDSLEAEVKDDILKGVVKASKADVKNLASKSKRKQKAVASQVKKGKISSVKKALSRPSTITTMAAPYRRAVLDIKRIAREITSISSDPSAGRYLATKQTRILNCLGEAEDAINQCEPVGQCDSCGGQGCNACYGTGFLSRAAADSKGQ